MFEECIIHSFFHLQNCSIVTKISNKKNIETPMQCRLNIFHPEIALDNISQWQKKRLC